MGLPLEKPMLATRILVGIWLLLSASCERQKTNITTEDPWTAKPRAPESDPIVAKVGTASIHASDVKRQAEQTGTNARVALDALIDLEVLADRARTLNFAPNADTLRAQKKAMVDVYMKREFEPTLGIENIKDDELRPIYERARSFFVRPRGLRLYVMTFTAGPTFGRTFEESRSLMRDFHAALKAKKAWTVEELDELTASSRWVEKKIKVSKGLVQSPGSPFYGKPSEILMALTKVGEFSPVFENEGGLHIAMCMEIFEAKNISFELMRDEIRSTYFPRWKKERFLAHADKLAQKFGVTVNDQALSVLDEK